MKLFFVIAILITVTACSDKKKGWPESEKKIFVNSCVSKAMAGSGMPEVKAKSYCDCYRQKIETKYPDIKELEKVKADEVSATAAECLEMLK